MEHVRSGLRLVSHAAVGVGAGSLAAVSTVLPSTGGAIDLIAVKQRDGSLKCSPFYVRFGKYQGLIRGREKVVTVTVNGVLMDFTMRLGRSGEAFFVVYDPDNPEAWVTANGSESEGDTDDDDPEVGSALDPRVAPHATPGSRSSPGESDEETTHPYLRSQASVRRRLAVASEGGDGTEARSGIPEENEDESTPVATLDDLKHLAESRGTPNQTLDELREVATALEAEERSNENGATSSSAGAGPGESKNGSQRLGQRQPTKPKIPSLGSSPAKDNGWGWLGWRGAGQAKGGLGTASTTPMGKQSTTPAGSVSVAAATMRTGSVADPSTPRSVASSASTASEAAPTTRVSSRPDLLVAGDDTGVGGIAVPPYDRGYLSEAEAEVALTGQLPERTRAGRRPKGRSEPPAVTTATVSIASSPAHPPRGIDGEVKRARRTSEGSVTGGGEMDTEAVPRMDTDTTTGTSSGEEREKEAAALISRLTLEDLNTQSHVTLPRLELSLCGGNLAEFDEHAVEPGLFAADPAAITTHPKLAVRPWRPPGMEAAPALPWAAAMPHLLGHMAFGTPLPTSYLPSLPLGAGGARASTPAKIPREDTAAMMNALDGEPRAAGVSAVNGGSPVPRRPRRKFRKSVTLDPDKVAQLGLRPGKNVIAFSFSSRVWGRQEVQAHAYLWDWNAKIVVSDVDGTITKSDLRGHVAAMVGKDWNHEGVAQLYNNIRDNGYQLMFLSSRAISHSKGTRRYLEKLTQDGETLTQGPVMLAPDPLSTALYREVVVRRPQEFKMRCLKTIRDLFPPDWNPFYAGFGNRETDTVSYAHVGVPPGRNFTINPKSEVVAETTRHTKTYSLAGINRLVYEVFPPVARHRRTRSGAADLTHCDTFADSNYWGKGFLNIDEIELP